MTTIIFLAVVTVVTASWAQYFIRCFSLQMTTIIFLAVVMVVTPSWAQYFIRNDAVPTILGAGGDTPFVTSTGNLLVSTSFPVHPQPSQQPFPELAARQPFPELAARQPFPELAARQPFPELAARQPFPELAARQPFPELAARQPFPELPARQPFPELPARQPVFVQPQLPSQSQVFIPQPQQVSPILPQFTFRPTSSLCNPVAKPLVDEVQDGRAYHFSWCHDSGRTYSWEQATYYCSGLGNGFQAVSIESRRKQELISSFIIAHYISDIWTSGNKLNSRSWSWLSGTSSPYSNWSRTGRRGLPQPDNDEGNEDCLAVLNNHYNDGVTWHDSSCFRVRRVICEARQFYTQ